MTSWTKNSQIFCWGADQQKFVKSDLVLMLQLATSRQALCLVSRTKMRRSTICNSAAQLSYHFCGRRDLLEPLPLRFWRWRLGSNLNKLKRLLHSFVSEIIVECAIKCSHHVINPNDLLDLLSCPKNSSRALFFLPRLLFIVSMGNHFKLE